MLQCTHTLLLTGLLEITFSWNVSKMSSIFQGMCKFPENIREYIQSLRESGNVYIPWKFQEIHIFWFDTFTVTYTRRSDRWKRLSVQPLSTTVASCIHYMQPVGATIAPTIAATIAPCIRPINLVHTGVEVGSRQKVAVDFGFSVDEPLED